MTPPGPINLSGAKLEVEPAQMRIDKPTDYAQLLGTAILPSGARTDVTRLLAWKVEGDIGLISKNGRFTPSRSGRGRIIGELGGQRLEVPVEIAEGAGSYVPSFVRDVNPILSR